MRSKRLRIILLVVAVLLLVAYLGASWYFSGLIVAFPQRTLAEAITRLESDGERSADPTDYGLPDPETVHIDAGDGITLAGWYFDNPEDGECGALFLHGWQGTRLHGLAYAPLVWERGCDLLMYDARHHGDSTGAFGTYGFYEKSDALKALDWFAERSQLETSRIGLMGVSYGAATVLQAAALKPDVAFVFADSPYQDLSSIVREQAVKQYGAWINIFVPTALQFAAWRANFDPQVVSPLQAIADIQAPVFLIHSLQDEFTDVSHSQAIYANADGGRTVLHLTDWGAAHARSILVDYDQFKAWFDEFLAQYAPGF